MKTKNPIKKSVNWKVVSYSILGLVCLGLGYSVHYVFLLGCAIAIIVNQRELMKK